MKNHIATNEHARTTPHDGASKPQNAGHEASGHGSAYAKLALMLLLSFIAMYILMYAMVDKLEDVIPNINQGYMAALMTAPMGIIELALMRRMYPHGGWNLTFVALSVLLFAVGWTGMRQQLAVNDEQFLKSMIPHHSGALLMCREAALQRTEVRTLCEQITRTQIEEIAQMRAMLATQGD